MEETTGLSKQQKKSMETKEKIFKAAKRILQRSGYETLSIKNICEEAGVSNGSFYHHFKTKDDLLSYYIEDQPSINPDLLDLPENAEDAKRTIIQVYLNYVSYCKELGVEFMAGYYDTKKPDGASVSNRDSTELCGKSNKRRKDSDERGNRGIYHGHSYDCDRKRV